MRHTKDPYHVDVSAIRESVSKFLNDSSSTRSPARREIKHSVNSVVQTILSAGWEAYIVGGTIRDIILGPKIVGSGAYYPRDVDIVVVGVDNEEIRAVFKHLYDRDTRFGGVHLIDYKPEGWKVMFDVWALQATWGFTVQALPMHISSFPQLPFLNLDTAVVEIQALRGRPRQVFENGFVEGINERTIEINFEPNPYPEICMVRALIMAAKLGFTIGPRLFDFVLRRAESTPISVLMDAQRSHYGSDRCEAETLLNWLKTLEQQASDGFTTGNITMKIPDQLALWNNYPSEAQAQLGLASNMDDLVFK